MTNPLPLLARAFTAVFLAVSFHGCALPLGPNASVTKDRAFITYSPAGGDSGKLRLAVKDIIDMEGKVTTAGSQYLAKNGSPARRDAQLLGPARRSDVTIVGKANLTEFALGTSGANEYFGTPINPLDHHRIPGGSSSGSAVAVANGEADVAFGSDTAGSIRVPAAFCGLLGLKTTFGLVPLKGVFPLSPKHLDTVGPMAKDVPNLIKGMQLLQPGFSAGGASGKQIRVGRLNIPGTDPKIEQSIDDALKAAGFRVVPLGDDFRTLWDQAQSNGTTIAVADGWLSDQQYQDKAGVSSTTKATIALGQLQYSTGYKGALDGRRVWRRALSRVFDKVDFIALPTVKSLPPHRGLFERSVLFEARVLALQNTVAVNYAGNPAIAIPIPYPDDDFGVTSLQLIGRRLDEAGLVNAARVVMAKAPVTLKRDRH